MIVPVEWTRDNASRQGKEKSSATKENLLGVRGCGDNGHVQLFELFVAVREGDDLRRADERAPNQNSFHHSTKDLQVTRVEEEDDVFAFVVGQLHLFEIDTDNCIHDEVRGRLSDERLRHLQLSAN